MNIKQILAIAFLSIFVVGGAGRAASTQLDEEHDAYNLVTHLFGGAANGSIAGWLDTYCKKDWLGNNPSCDTDIWSDNFTGNFLFPKSLSGQVKSDLISVLKTVIASTSGMKDDFWNLGYCQNGYADSSRSVTVSAKVFGSVCADLGYTVSSQTKANAVMAPHPLVIRQNNKALRGNAPQTMKGRPVNQNQQSRANTQKSQPHVMPPLNQGRKGPQTQPQHHGMMPTAPHPHMLPPVNQGKNALKQSTAHPGMMPIDPHHSTVMPPVNQGRNAPKQNTAHPGMVPVENRGRTTPPRMMKIAPPHSG